MTREGFESKVGHRQESMQHDASRVGSAWVDPIKKFSEIQRLCARIFSKGGTGHKLGCKEARLTLNQQLLQWKNIQAAGDPILRGRPTVLTKPCEAPILSSTNPRWALPQK